MRPGHAPLIAELKVGQIAVSGGPSGPLVFACSGGILEVSGAGMVVLADAVERGADIDAERARQAEQRARERLQQRRDANVDASRAEIALSRAVNRLRTAGRPM